MINFVKSNFRDMRIQKKMDQLLIHLSHIYVY
uniref:Uncharacterized protein n=1 Tax=Phage sp. ctL4h4 TaxID=2828005 RepID=A0A8S5TFK3_9VIRU|nr:MAG TPA: hypothetical protein [Phage sp. ctL4h4]